VTVVEMDGGAVDDVGIEVFWVVVVRGVAGGGVGVLDGCSVGADVVGIFVVGGWEDDCVFGWETLKCAFNCSSKSCLVTSGPIARLVRPSLQIYEHLQVEICRPKLLIVPDHQDRRRCTPFAETGQKFFLL